MQPKDYFSQQARTYATFRPAYPEALYQFLFTHLNGNSAAWDCATGNGQVAHRLAHEFKSVYATDISQAQLDNALKGENIFYSIARAEKTGFDNEQFDLITVAQALHWFDLSSFYDEVRRTLKRGGLLAVWGYSLLTVDADIDPLFQDFYFGKVGPYWDEARKLVEDRYATLAFPFSEIACPEFSIDVAWSLDQFAGYLRSWSATQKYISVNGSDPVEKFRHVLAHVWKPEEVKAVRFPVFMRLGKILS